jgi:hypothetical protein
MNWSRLQSKDLDGLRGMCEGFYKDEAVSIYKIPNEYYNVLSGGWFSPSQSCSSIFVPFHISNYDVYAPYETGEAAQLCQNLFQIYGYNNLSCFEDIEDLLLYENEFIEDILLGFIENKDIISDILTVFDTTAQEQAYFIENIWFEINNVNNSNEKELLSDIINTTWELNYSNSLVNMKNSILELVYFDSTSKIIQYINDFALNLCKSRIEIAKFLGKQSEDAIINYILGEQYINNFEYELGFNNLIQCYKLINNIIIGY